MLLWTEVWGRGVPPHIASIIRKSPVLVAPGEPMVALPHGWFVPIHNVALRPLVAIDIGRQEGLEGGTGAGAVASGTATGAAAGAGAGAGAAGGGSK